MTTTSAIRRSQDGAAGTAEGKRQPWHASTPAASLSRAARLRRRAALKTLLEKGAVRLYSAHAESDRDWLTAHAQVIEQGGADSTLETVIVKRKITVRLKKEENGQWRKIIASPRK